jgi:hypothetical protein
MKLFRAEARRDGYWGETNFRWCNENEILVFGQFQNERDVCMVGLETRKGATHIILSELDISLGFYKDLFIRSVEKGFNCTVDEQGFYSLNNGGGQYYNVNELVDELVRKAADFNVGDRLKCLGRNITLRTPADEFSYWHIKHLASDSLSEVKRNN